MVSHQLPTPMDGGRTMTTTTTTTTRVTVPWSRRWFLQRTLVAPIHLGVIMIAGMASTSQPKQAHAEEWKEKVESDGKGVVNPSLPFTKEELQKLQEFEKDVAQRQREQEDRARRVAQQTKSRLAVGRIGTI